MPYLQLIRSNYKSSTAVQSNKIDKKTERERQLDFHHKTRYTLFLRY